MARVRLENVTKRFGKTEVIGSINLDIADGEFVVIVGPSGCGKSTLLRLIAGLEETSSGSIWIADDEVTQRPPAQRGVSMVFQTYALYPHMDVYRNISFGLKMSGAGSDTVEQRVRRAAKMLQITDLLHRKPRELSGGQRQRVAIARSIVREPKVFLFDAPLSNLDAALRAQTRLEIARLHDELSSTMIYVTHDQQEAMTLADRIVLLNKGRIEQIGTPGDLYRRPATRFAASFIGSPAMNILPARINDGQAILGTGETLAVGTQHSGPADIGVRPESILLAGPDQQGALRARVIHIEDLGEARIIHTTLADGSPLAVRYPADLEPPRRGDHIALHADPLHLHIFGKDGVRIA